MGGKLGQLIHKQLLYNFTVCVEDMSRSLSNPALWPHRVDIKYKSISTNFSQIVDFQYFPYHSYQDAWSKGHLVECSKSSSQFHRGHFLDVEWIKTHHQAAKKTKDQPSQDENLKWLAGFRGEHQTRSHHRHTVHY